MKKKSMVIKIRIIYVFLIIAILLFPLFQKSHVLAGSFNCWNCQQFSLRSHTKNCSDCGWDICSNCGACSYNCSKGGTYWDWGIVSYLIIFIGILGFIVVRSGAVVSFLSDKRNSKNILNSPQNNINADKYDEKMEHSPSLGYVKNSTPVYTADAPTIIPVSYIELPKQELIDRFNNISDNSILYHKTFGKLIVKEISVNNIIVIEDDGNRRVLVNNIRIINNLYYIELE